MPVSKIWNGTQWVKPFLNYPKIWDGTQWVIGRTRVRGASSWCSVSSQTVTVTVGASTFAQMYVGTEYNYGFSVSKSFGSISPNTATIVDSFPIYVDLYWYQFTRVSGTASYSTQLVFQGIDSIIAEDAGPWTNMNIAGYNFARSSATQSISGNEMSFVWSGTATNPFGTTEGATKTVTFS